VEERREGLGRGARTATLLSLAAAPAFALMALLSIVASDAPSALICSTAHGPSWLTGMLPMYLLMSAFHLGPWLRLRSAPEPAVVVNVAGGSERSAA